MYTAETYLQANINENSQKDWYIRFYKYFEEIAFLSMVFTISISLKATFSEWLLPQIFIQMQALMAVAKNLQNL